MGFWSILLRLILACSLLLAGLPAHACLDASEATDLAPAQSPAMADHDGCPHHAPPTEQADSADSPEESGSDCCGLFCRCGCSAPLPAITLLTTAGTFLGNSQATAAPTVLAPALSIDPLLRPPQPLS